MKTSQSKYNYEKVILDFSPKINIKSYTISPDGSLLATINESNHFSLYFLEDIALGRILSLYTSTKETVSALSVANLSN